MCVMKVTATNIVFNFAIYSFTDSFVPFSILTDFPGKGEGGKSMHQSRKGVGWGGGDPMHQLTFVRSDLQQFGALGTMSGAKL